MKNEIVAKVNKIGNIGYNIVSIAKIIITVLIVAVVLDIILLFTLPKDLISIDTVSNANITVDFDKVSWLKNFNPLIIFDNDNLTTSIDIDDKTYYIDNYSSEKGFVDAQVYSKSTNINLGSMQIIMVFTVIFLISVYMVVNYLKVLLKQFKYCDTPFKMEIVDTLKKLVISVIPMTILFSVLEVVSDFFIKGKTDIIIKIDITTVVLVILVILLISVFKYGTMLQQESDETL